MARQPFHILVKPTGAKCNLACTYCFYLPKEDLYPQSSFRMTDQVLEAFICQLLETHPDGEVSYTWQGGEPTLMGLDFFKKADELEQKYRKPGTRIRHSIQTNGILLDEAWCQFFKDHQFLVGLSLDGLQEHHDRYRRKKSGEGTFQQVVNAAMLLRKHQVEFNILCTVNAENEEYGKETYRFLRDEVGARFLQFIPIVAPVESPSNHASGVRRVSVSPDGYGRFLCDVFDEWLLQDVGKVFVQMFDVALAGWAGQSHGLCVHSPTCGRALALEHNGDLYSCDHFVDPDHLLGNILAQPMGGMIESESQKKFGWKKSTALPNICLVCPVEFICQGGCLKDRIRTGPSGGEDLNYLCDSYRMFFTHIRKPMDQMAKLLSQRRPPSEIMKQNR